MTDKSKTPPAKKTIQDPPEYAAANTLKGHENQAGYQQNGQSYQQNGQSAVAPASSNPKERNETIRLRHEWWDKSEPVAQEGIARNPQRSEPPAPEEGAQGEGARNPQTGERIARNRQTGE